MVVEMGVPVSTHALSLPSLVGVTCQGKDKIVASHQEDGLLAEAGRKRLCNFLL